MAFVNSYEKIFRDAFDRGLEAIRPEDKEALVKKLVDEICEATVDRVRSAIDEDLLANVRDNLCREAARVAESMLMTALAGDDAALRNLFGFDDWYMKTPYVGQLPTQWKLIEALIERRPDLFVDERIAQRDAEVEALRRDNERLEKQVAWYRENR